MNLIMKRYLSIVLVFVSAVFAAIGQDNYSGRTRIKGEDIEYRVIIEGRFQSGTLKFICLDNVANVLSDLNPYDKVARQYYSEARHPMPLAQPDYDLHDQLVDSIFSDDDKKKYFSKLCHLYATFRIDPLTRHAIEVKFSLHYTSSDDRILALPVFKIEQLEKTLKSDLIFYVPERGRDADFLLISGRLL